MAQETRRKRRRSGALWTVRWRGSDPFGGAILKPDSALAGLKILVEAKKRGYIDLWSGHDDDIVPWDPKKPNDYLDPADPIHETLRGYKELLEEAGLPMHMITCSLHGHPVFAAGGFTNRDPAIRLLAMQKALRAAWIGNYFGATVVTYWVARDGFESPITVPIDENENPHIWLKQALNIISKSCRNNGYSIKQGTIEPKIDEPRGVSYVPLVGSALALISELDDPEFWGVNPEIPQHSGMGCQSPFLEIFQAVVRGKLFFLHIGGQTFGVFDCDYPFLVGDGSETMIAVFRYLDLVDWDGVIEFDCHPLRSDAAPEISAEEEQELFLEFLGYNARMYRMVEAIIVPRLKANSELTDALTRLNSSAVEDSGSFAGIIRTAAENGDTDEIVWTKLPISNLLKRRQNHLAVSEAFNFALYGVTDEELEAAMA